MLLRFLKNNLYRWKYLLLCVTAIYCLCVLPDGISYSFFKTTRNIDNEATKQQKELDLPKNEQKRQANDLSAQATMGDTLATKESYLLKSRRYGDHLYIEDIVGEPEGSLHDRMIANVDKNAPPKVILSWDAGHSAANLGGCEDWNCRFTTDRNFLKDADAVLVMSENHEIAAARRPDQYIVYFSQESPIHSHTGLSTNNFFNLSLNFRRDTAASSPYGYTVKLAPESRPKNGIVDEKLIDGKNMTAAWFVSHCGTHSKRETYVEKLQKYMEVDIYGSCGKLRCPRGAQCEDVLDTRYFFYIAFENSICKDYLTEKLWSQGYQRTVVPLVLKREHVEPFVPPHSFIATDDFNTVEELAQYLQYLMKNKTAYMEYFKWRSEYKVIFLDGSVHDDLERPWGFCQLCRLAWKKPPERHVIQDFTQFWTHSCEIQGELVNKLIDGKADSKSLVRDAENRRSGQSAQSATKMAVS